MIVQKSVFKLKKVKDSLNSHCKRQNNYNNLPHGSWGQSSGLWKITWKFLFHGFVLSNMSVAMPNTICKEMVIHCKRCSNWSFHNISRRPDHLCTIWLCYGSILCIKVNVPVRFYKFISLSVSHSSCLWGESQWRWGFLSEGECIVRTWIMFALFLGLCSGTLSQHFSLSKAADVRCSSKLVITNPTKQKQGNKMMWSHSGGSDSITQLTQHRRPFLLT